MRTLRMAVAVMALGTVTAPSVFAQDHTQAGGWQDSAGYLTGLGGFQAATGSTTGDVLIEGGVRVAPHVMVFGDLSWFKNLQADLTSTLNNTVSSLQNTEGLNVTAAGTLPAAFSIGGVPIEIPSSDLFLPYLFGGAGVSHLNPTQQFVFASGTMPDGTTPAAGQDITSNLTTSGVFTPTPASNALMYTIGGGVLIPVAQRWVIDAAYRTS